MQNISIQWIISNEDDPKKTRTFISHEWPFGDLPQIGDEVSVNCLSTIVEGQKDKNKNFSKSYLEHSNRKVKIDEKLFDHDEIYFKDGQNIIKDRRFFIIYKATFSKKVVPRDSRSYL